MKQLNSAATDFWQQLKDLQAFETAQDQKWIKLWPTSAMMYKPVATQR